MFRITVVSPTGVVYHLDTVQYKMITDWFRMMDSMHGPLQLTKFKYVDENDLRPY